MPSMGVEPILHKELVPKTSVSAIPPRAYIRIALTCLEYRTIRTQLVKLA